MIRINLALLKRPAGVAAASGGSEESQLLSRLRQFGISPSRILGAASAPAADQRAVLRSLAVVAVLWLVLDFTLTSYRDDELAKLEAELGEVQSQRQKLEGEVNQRASYEKERIRLEAEEKLIQAKVATLDRLSSGRDAPRQVLELVSSRMPAEVWLSEFEVQKEMAVFSGFSENAERVTDFMSELDRSAHFFEAVPRIENQLDTATGSSMTRFELRLQRRTGNGG